MKTKNKNIAKPKLQSSTYYDWSDIENYLYLKESIKQNESAEDLWHFIVDIYEPQNGTTHTIDFEYLLEVSKHKWQKDIVKTLMKELPAKR